MTFSAVSEPRPDLAERADRLVGSARDLANETGSAAFTVAQVTGRAGLSLKAFYACFPGGKDDLLLALLAADSAIGAQVLADRIGDRAGREGVRAYFVELFDMLQLPGALGYAGVLVREYRRLIEERDDDQRAALAPLVDLLARHLESTDPRDAETMFSVLVAGIHDVVVGRVTDPSAHARYLYRFCSEGVS
jgi:AcrR family transcriptional regulator